LRQGCSGSKTQTKKQKIKKMKITIEYLDGARRSVGGSADIATCLDIDLGKGWVEAHGEVWAAKSTHPSAKLMVNGEQTSLDWITQ
jgi:membrane-bound ClpP family serine protease